MRVIVNCTVNIAYPQISSRQLPHFEVPPDASFAFLSIAAGTAPPSCGGSLAWSSRSPRLKQKNPRVREAFCSVCFGVRSCCDMLLYVARKSSILSRMVLAATRSIQFFELSIARKYSILQLLWSTARTCSVFRPFKRRCVSVLPMFTGIHSWQSRSQEVHGKIESLNVRGGNV